MQPSMLLSAFDVRPEAVDLVSLAALCPPPHASERLDETSNLSSMVNDVFILPDVLLLILINELR